MGTFLAATSQALIVGRVSSSSTNPAAPSVHSLSVRNNPAIGRQDISAAQWSADGNRRILIGGSDGASVYDEEGERVEEILKGEMVAAVAVGARTGDTIVAAERIHARSADGKQLAERLEGHPSAPTLLALSNDSSLLASYSPYPNTLLCHTRSSGTHFTLNFKPARSVTCIAFSPTRKTLLAAGTSAGGVHLFDTSKPGSPLRTWGDMHTGKVMAVAFAPIKAQLMISAGMDGVVKVTDLDRQMVKSTLQFGAPLTSLAWSATGTIILIGTETGKVFLQDLRMGQSRRPPTLVIDESGSAVHSLHFAPPVAAARAGQAVVVAGSKSTAPSTLPEKATIRSILADTGRAANLSADPPPRAGGEGALSQTATAIATADQSQSQSKPLKTSAAHQHQHQHLERERTSSPPQVQTQQPNRLSGRKRAVPDYAIASASSSSSSRPGSRNEGEGDGRAQATEGALPASTSSGSSPSGSYPVGIAPFNARHTSALESSSPDKNATEDQTQGQVHRSRNGNERRVMSENNDGYLGVGSQWRSRTRLDERGLETASGSASASGSRSGSSPTPAPRLAVESSRSDTGAELERKVGRDRKLRREADREKADREKDRDGDGEGEREGTKEGYQPAAAASWLLPSGVGVGVGVGVRPGSGIRTGIGIGVAERATGNEVSSSTDRSMGLALALPHSVSHSVGHSSSSSPCPLEVGAAAPAPAPGSARRAERSDAAESDDGLNPCCRALLDGALDRLRESFEARMQELHVDMLGAQRRQRVELAALLERYLLGGGAECGGGKEGDGEGAGGGAKEAVLELRRENARLRRVVGMSREARGF